MRKFLSRERISAAEHGKVGVRVLSYEPVTIVPQCLSHFVHFLGQFGVEVDHLARIRLQVVQFAVRTTRIVNVLPLTGAKGEQIDRFGVDVFPGIRIRGIGGKCLAEAASL